MVNYLTKKKEILKGKMKSLKMFLLINFIFLILSLTSSLVSASVSWISENSTIAPLNNFLLNISWTNSTRIGTGTSDYQLNNITFNLINTTGSLSLSYIVGSNNSNIADLTFGTGDNTLVVWGNATQNTTKTSAWFAFNISAPQAGVYEITITEHYSNGTAPGTAPFVNNTSTLILTVNPGDVLVSLSYENITYGQTEIINCSANNTDSTANLTLWLDNSLLRSNASSSPIISYTFDASKFSAGDYTLTCNISATENFTSASKPGVFKINKAPTWIRLFLNGTEGNKSYDASAPANFTAVLNVPGKTVCIETNFTVGWEVCGVTPLYNYTTIPSVTSAIYNITAYFAGDTNYSSNSTTYWITVGDTTPPTVSLSLSASRIYRGDSITISCSASDNVGVVSSSLTIEKPSGTIVSATCNSAFTDTTQLGTYTVTYTASDAANNSASESASFTVVSAGGAVTPPVHRKAHIWSKITPGAAAIWHIFDPELGLKQISISVKNPANNVKITITKLDKKPATIVHEVTGKVYKYFEITHQNIEENLDKAVIEFQVEKSWIEENNINESTVALYRYTTEWEKLPSKKVSEDADYVYYRAETPGFSVFAISGEVKKPAVATTTTIKATTTIATTIPATTTIPTKKPPVWYGVGTIVVIVIIIAVLMFLKRR